MNATMHGTQFPQVYEKQEVNKTFDLDTKITITAIRVPNHSHRHQEQNLQN